MLMYDRATGYDWQTKVARGLAQTCAPDQPADVKYVQNEFTHDAHRCGCLSDEVA